MSEEEALATMHAAVSGAYAEARTELTAWRGGGVR
jgi:hypothetical protein